ncbi:aspartoacylase [Oceanidesulfovibrio indonesiensis]|uniref:Aspartoacylase n=1 Tax=Oceanidesulfovibrio indonesiensis TaxID=54767 RepID=A0A7M3MIG3_9BACT|nr:aspartoacylase [Oceanidesulfovibrio indonesiensis]TVM19484.1 aspartoacylase [Oceanidesulfovibrio indonesiensis]
MPALPDTPDFIRSVALVGGTHGDELTGVHLVRAFLRNPRLVERPGMNVTPLIANEAAVAAGRRDLGHDLNRAFAAADLANPELDAYEQVRARQINALLGPKGPSSKTDLILDFHSAASDMGLNCNITGEDPWLFRLVALAIRRLAEHTEPLAVRCYQFPAPAGDAPYLPSIARHGLGIEVGPIAPGSMNAEIYFRTRRLALTLLDLVAEYNQGAWPDETLSLDVYTQVATIPFPEGDDGGLGTMVHPERIRAVYEPILPGDPLFVGFDGAVIPYGGEAGLFPTFVNEPSYYPKNIALCLARRTQRQA